MISWDDHTSSSTVNLHCKLPYSPLHGEIKTADYTAFVWRCVSVRFRASMIECDRPVLSQLRRVSRTQYDRILRVFARTTDFSNCGRVCIAPRHERLRVRQPLKVNLQSEVIIRRLRPHRRTEKIGHNGHMKGRMVCVPDIGLSLIHI